MVGVERTLTALPQTRYCGEVRTGGPHGRPEHPIQRHRGGRTEDPEGHRTDGGWHPHHRRGARIQLRGHRVIADRIHRLHVLLAATTAVAVVILAVASLRVQADPAQATVVASLAIPFLAFA